MYLKLFLLLAILQEQNTVPALRKAIKDIAMEKDAAVVARVLNPATILLVHHSFPYSNLLFSYKPLFAIGGFCCPASHTKETHQGSRRRAVPSKPASHL